jgi:mono/diheme cytochrome c family protein
MAVMIIVTGVLYACSSGETKSDKKPTALTPEQMVARGEYLVTAVGCDDCHSPKRMGPQGPEVIPELRLSGYPSSRPVQKGDTGALGKGWMLFSPDLTSAVGPWGTSFSANITSDATGIGSWKEENFINAIRNGKIKGLQNGRSILPPMPWPNFAKFSDEDLKSIFAYLKTTKPVSNVAPAPVPPGQM